MFAPPAPPSEGVTLAVLEGYTGDCFYLSQDGHFVGEDGFVVPKDFVEFHTRYPDYVFNWVKKHLYNASTEDIEDWGQELLMHLSHLPEGSKHRAQGRTDVVQTFNPFKQYGASERRFRNYINLLLLNKFRTFGSKQARNPLSCSANMSLSEDTPVTHDSRIVSSEEYIYQHASQLSQGSQDGFKAQEDKLLTGEFLSFVAEEEPDAAPILTAVLEAGGNFADARRFWCESCFKLASIIEIESGVHNGHNLGIDQRRFNRFRGRLKELASQFREN